MLQEAAVSVCNVAPVFTFRTVQVVSTPEADTVSVDPEPEFTRFGLAEIVGTAGPQENVPAVTVIFGQAFVTPPAVTDMPYVPGDEYVLVSFTPVPPADPPSDGVHV